MADQRKAFRPESALRLFVYAAFVVSSLLLMVSMSAPGWNWRPGLVGTLIFGAFTVVMYRQEEGRRIEVAEASRAQAARTRNFDLVDDEDSDPTQPPTRIR